MEQVLCKTLPFPGLTASEAFVEAVNGICPAKPEEAASLGFTDGLWEIVEQCWLVKWDERPTLSAVLSCLREAALGWSDRQKFTSGLV